MTELRDGRGVFYDLYGTLLISGGMHAAWEDWLSTMARRLDAAGTRLDRDAEEGPVRSEDGPLVRRLEDLADVLARVGA